MVIGDQSVPLPISSRMLNKQFGQFFLNVYEKTGIHHKILTCFNLGKLIPNTILSALCFIEQSSVGQHEEKLYETLNSSASTAVLTSSMPHRTAPLPPSPPEPPRAPRPSQKVTLPPDEEEPRPGVSSWSGTHYPESTVLKGMSRGQR